MDIIYTIKFFSGWHCGSGLSAGPDVDTLVIKDKNRLPFIPGKTVKGLLREAVEEYVSLTNCIECDQSKVNSVFGHFDSADESKNAFSRGVAFFTNAELSSREAKAIVQNNAQDLLYKKLSATAIGENGIAKDHSLRRIEVVVPCEMHGKILDVPESFAKVLTNSMGLIKRIGSWRNRGLGRCIFEVGEDK